MTPLGSKFFLRKRTGTHADGLAACGLAYFLARIGGGNPRQVTITDRGELFELTLDRGLTDDDIKRWGDEPDTFYEYIKLKDDRDAPPQAFDYVAESGVLAEAKKRRAQKRSARGKASKLDLTDSESARLDEAARTEHPEIQLLRVFNGMRKNFKGDIEFHRALRAAPPVESLIARLGRMRTSAEPADDAAPPALPLRASQWFMPLSGKGVSRVKADGATPSQFPDRHLDWFEVWMGYIGMFRAMTQHSFGDDLKLAVIAPADIRSDAIKILRDDLRGAKIFGGKIDVRAPLELARALVKHSEEYRSDQSIPTWLRFSARAPREVVRGLHVTTYKKMGTASSVMNVAFLGIPSWARIATRDDAEAFLATLEDLDAYQRVLRDDISDDIETLRAMRDFISSGSLELTLEFLGRVAVDVMRRLAAKKYSALLRTETVGGIMKGIAEEKVGPIIDDAGFQRVAKAVRAATIHAQLYEDTKVRPQYGLAQAWRLRAAYGTRFVESLTEFVQKFNAEVTRRRQIDAEKGRRGDQYPALVTTDDLSSVLRLIDTHGSSLVAHLLLAFGFAQVAKKDSTIATVGGQ